MGNLGQVELRTSGSTLYFVDLQEITGYTTLSEGSDDGLHINIMRERGEPRDHFEKSFLVAWSRLTVFVAGERTVASIVRKATDLQGHSCL